MVSNTYFLYEFHGLWYIIISDAKESVIDQIEGLDVAKTSHTALLFLSTVAATVVRNWKNKKYMILQKDFDKAECYAKNINAVLFETGGSVSTLAVDLAVRMECSSLTCVGLDLAYTNGKIHANDCKSYDEGDIGKDGNTITVRSVDGIDIQTTTVYEIYRKFIESRLAQTDAGMDIYNTSKGAYIQGMKHISMEELICR